MACQVGGSLASEKLEWVKCDSVRAGLPVFQYTSCSCTGTFEARDGSGDWSAGWEAEVRVPRPGCNFEFEGGTPRYATIITVANNTMVAACLHVCASL